MSEEAALYETHRTQPDDVGRSGGPAAMSAKDHEDHRYYDRHAKDYHEWNEREDWAYRRYLQDQHREYRDWRRANRREQDDYWRWRHQHDDRVLWP